MQLYMAEQINRLVLRGHTNVARKALQRIVDRDPDDEKVRVHRDGCRRRYILDTYDFGLRSLAVMAMLFSTGSIVF